MARRVIDYGIIEADDRDELCEAVNNQLHEGWEPLGGWAASQSCSRNTRAIPGTPKPW